MYIICIYCTSNLQLKQNGQCQNNYKMSKNKLIYILIRLAMCIWIMKLKLDMSNYHKKLFIDLMNQYV